MPLKTIPIPELTPEQIDRFWQKIDRSGGDLACWIWTAAKDPKGYGRVGFNNRTYFAHRVAHFLRFGPIADGLPIDHLCRNPSCCNPDHIEAVDVRTNLLRGNHPSAVMVRENMCRRGHDLSGDNVRWVRRPDGTVNRTCRQCSNANSLRSWYRRRDAILPKRRQRWHEHKDEINAKRREANRRKREGR